MTQDEPVRFVIDRFEGEWAVVETEQGRTFSVPRSWLPDAAREGDVVSASRSINGSAATIRFELDPTARDQRLTDAQELRSALPRGPKGDLKL